MKKTTGCLVLRGDIYYLRYSVNGKVKQKSLGVTTLPEAEKERDRILAPALAAKSREDILYHVAQSRKLLVKCDVTLADVWDTYLKNTKRPDSGKSTLVSYKIIFEKFKTWLVNNRPHIKKIGDLTEIDCEDYSGYLWADGVASSTFNNSLLTLKLITKTLLGTSPFAGIRPKTSKTVNHKNFTQDEVLAILKVFDKPGFEIEDKAEMRTLFYIGAFTGLRVGDCACLKWENVNLTNGHISLKPRKTVRINRQVSIPLHPMLRDALTRTPKNETPYILPKLMERYGRGCGILNRGTTQVFKAAGFETNAMVEGMGQRKNKSPLHSFHSFRSSFASFAANAGVPLATLASILGDNVATLAKYYIHASSESRDKTIASLPNALPVKSLPTGERTPKLRLAEIMEIVTTAKMAAGLRKRLLDALRA